MISTFDLLSFGIDFSSSYAEGAMRSAKLFVDHLQKQNLLAQVNHINCQLFGLLGQKGLSYGIGKAVILGLSGKTPETIKVNDINCILNKLVKNNIITLAHKHTIPFIAQRSIIYHHRKTLPAHTNAMTLFAYHGDQVILHETYYAIAGGLIVQDSDFKK